MSSLASRSMLEQLQLMAMATQPPLKLTDEIRTYCDKIAPGTEPYFVAITPEPGAKPLHCFDNVRNQIRTHGGHAINGWSIYVWPRVWIEFEFHCVWRPTPELLVRDITPRSDSDTQCLFLPDPTREFAGSRITNPKFALSNPNLVDKLISLSDKRPTGSIDARQMASLVQKLAWSPKPNDPCLCGSRRKFKKCCARQAS